MFNITSLSYTLSRHRGKQGTLQGNRGLCRETGDRELCRETGDSAGKQGTLQGNRGLCRETGDSTSETKINN